MHTPVPFSTPLAFLLFCVCTGSVPGFAPTTRAAEDAAPAVRQPIVGGTPFPDLRHYQDPVTRSEVWSVSPPRPAGDETEASPPPIYVSPEINLAWPGGSQHPQPRQP